MDFPLMGLLRLTALTALALGVVAVGLGQMNPTPGGTRAAAPIVHVGIDINTRAEIEGSARLLDLRTGRLDRLDLPADELVEHLSCSPWRDARGEAQLVGLRIRFDAGFAAREFGLIRLTYPGGAEVDRVATDILPTAPPCWYPGTAPRILYSACDGALYHFAFADRGQGGDAAPRPLTWRNPSEGLADARMLDPVWPSEPALRGRFLVSMNVREKGGRGRYDGEKLWWLQLNAAGTEIVAAGRLTRPDAGQGRDSEVEERLPAVGRSTSGDQPVLTYLARTSMEKRWRVRIAPLRFDTSTGAPYLDPAQGRVLAEGCETLTPTISTDGRWAVCLREQSFGSPVLTKIPLTPPGPDALSDRDGLRSGAEEGGLPCR